MLVSWLMNTITPEVKATLSRYDDARRLWKDLKERFSSVDGPKIHQVKSDLARCVQTRGMTIGTYYAKLKMLWDDLNKYEPLIACTCSKCTCDVVGQHETRREKEHFHQFFMGLQQDLFGNIRSQLLGQTPLPTLNRAYQQVSQEERVHGIVQTEDERPDVVGFAVRTEGKGMGRGTKVDKARLICSYCKYSGHEISSCFELHGYPDWWGDRPRAVPKGVGRGKPNTSEANRGKPSAKAHAAAVENSKMSQPSTSTGDGSFGQSTPLPGFSVEQWKSLISTFGNLSSSNDRMVGPSLEEADWNG